MLFLWSFFLIIFFIEAYRYFVFLMFIKRPHFQIRTSPASSIIRALGQLFPWYLSSWMIRIDVDDQSSLGMVRMRINDPRSLGSLWIKRIDEFLSGWGSAVLWCTMNRVIWIINSHLMLFCLKFKTGSCFLKSIKRFCTLGQKDFKINVVSPSVLVVIFT